MSFLKKLLKGGLPGKNGLPKNLPGASKVPAPPGFGGGGKKGPKANPALNMGVRDTSSGLAPRAGMPDEAAAPGKAVAEQAAPGSFLSANAGTRLYPNREKLQSSIGDMNDRARRLDRR